MPSSIFILYPHSLMKWRLIVNKDLPGYKQMAMDEAIYHFAATAKMPVLRLYTWEAANVIAWLFSELQKCCMRALLCA